MAISLPNIGSLGFHPIATLNSFSGPGGTFRGLLDQIPGSATYVLIFTIIYAFYFVYSIKAVQNEGLGKVYVAALLAGISSYVYFGRMDTTLRMIVIFAVLWFIAKNFQSNEMYGSSAERKAASEAGYNMGREKRIIKWLRKGDKVKGWASNLFHKKTNQEKLEEKQNKEEEMLVERNAELGLHETSIAAGAKKIADTINAGINEDLSTEEKERTVEETIEKIDDALSELKIGDSIDEATSNYLIQYGESIAKSIMKFESYEEFEEKEGHETIEIMKKCTKMGISASRYAKQIDADAIKVERWLAKAESKGMKELEKFIETKRKFILKKVFKLKTGQYGTRNNAFKAQLENQIVEIKKQADNDKKNLETLKLIDAKLKRLLLHVKWVLRKLKKDLSEILSSEENSLKFEEKATENMKIVSQNIELLKKATTAFNKTFDKLQSKNELPALIGAELTKETGDIFGIMKNTKGKYIRYEKEGLYPFITSLVDVLKKGSTVVDSLDYLMRAQYHLTKAYEDLDRLADSVIKGTNARLDKELKKDYSIKMFEEKIEIKGVRQDEQVKGFFKTSYDELVQTVNLMKTYVDKLEDDFQKIEVLQAHTIKSLTGIMNVYYKRAKKVDSELKKEGKAILSEVKAANTGVEEARGEGVSMAHAMAGVR